jgi:hypothetical protein
MDRVGSGASGQKRPLAQISPADALPSAVPVLPPLPPPLHGPLTTTATTTPPPPVAALLPPVDLSGPLPGWMQYTHGDAASTEPPGSSCAVPLPSPDALARARVTLPENRLLMEAMVTTARVSVATDRPVFREQPAPPPTAPAAYAAPAAATGGPAQGGGVPVLPPAVVVYQPPPPLPGAVGGGSSGSSVAGVGSGAEARHVTAAARGARTVE